MRYVGRGESVEDLIQVGAVALIQASDRFDPDRGVPFGTFAAPAATWAIAPGRCESPGSSAR
jgi:RNA polymerase sigma-B factor